MVFASVFQKVKKIDFFYSSGIERPSGSGPGLCSLFNYYLHCDFEAYPPRTMMEWNKLKNLAWWFGINRTIH